MGGGGSDLVSRAIATDIARKVPDGVGISCAGDRYWVTSVRILGRGAAVEATRAEPVPVLCVGDNGVVGLPDLPAGSVIRNLGKGEAFLKPASLAQMDSFRQARFDLAWGFDREVRVHGDRATRLAMAAKEAAGAAL